MKLVLKHAVDRNLVRESFLAKTNAFDAWRQVVEVVFAVCPEDILSLNDKQTVLVSLLKELLLQVGHRILLEICLIPKFLYLRK